MALNNLRTCLMLRPWRDIRNSSRTGLSMILVVVNDNVSTVTPGSLPNVHKLGMSMLYSFPSCARQVTFLIKFLHCDVVALLMADIASPLVISQKTGAGLCLDGSAARAGLAVCCLSTMVWTADGVLSEFVNCCLLMGCSPSETGFFVSCATCSSVCSRCPTTSSCCVGFSCN